ncbi:cytosine permease [Homoserinimonas sp. OAct 916]|uniref:purine-cytosine permease family protein n=1 Tax=Homoserinimonas sp. OAct 916 TaxID=2211450 RepID=UPI000DBE51A4|nr:cytosine permease [Homoserinimonas sp. OAct 916]
MARIHPAASTAGIERHTIEHVPETDRHGHPWSLFAVWFGANMQITTIVTGALGVVLGLPLPWAILAIVVGNLFGAVFMALHSAQGPVLGIPQMIQSRAQFGYFGAIVPLILVLLMYIGFFASSAVLGGQALATWWHIPFVLAAIILSIAITIVTIYGYRTIHRFERVVSVIAAIAFIYITIELFAQNNIGHAWVAGGEFTAGTFLLVVAIAATWQITYAPYVADYSRYLPSNTSIRASFWWTYAGTVIAAIWMMSLGSIAVAVASDAFNRGTSDFIVGLAPGGWGWSISIVLILGIAAVQVLNLYGMFMSSTTTIDALKKLRMHTSTRVWFILVAAVVGTAVGIIGENNFLQYFSNFILFLAYFLIPWTAINLADFYLVRHGAYDLDAIFDANGIYGRVNWRTMIAYVVAIVVEVPFVNSSFYVGPFVDPLGGADISWIIGMIVAAGLYVVLMRPVAARQLSQLSHSNSTTPMSTHTSTMAG